MHPGIQTTRRGSLAIVAAASETSGGWLTQWFQGIFQGKQGKGGTVSGGSGKAKKAAERAPQLAPPDDAKSHSPAAEQAGGRLSHRLFT